MRLPGRRDQRAGENPPARPAAMEEGTHPDPFRTRKLSPPSPMVLRRKAVGEQDAAGLTGGFSAGSRGRREGDGRHARPPLLFARVPYAAAGRPRRLGRLGLQVRAQGGPGAGGPQPALHVEVEELRAVGLHVGHLRAPLRPDREGLPRVDNASGEAIDRYVNYRVGQSWSSFESGGLHLCNLLGVLQLNLRPLAVLTLKPARRRRRYRRPACRTATISASRV